MELLRKNPNQARLYSNIGDCYFNQNLINEAIKYYSKAIEIDKNYINAYFNLGGCYYSKGDIKTARKIWLEGYKIDSNSALLKNILEKTGGLY